MNQDLKNDLNPMQDLDIIHENWLYEYVREHAKHIKTRIRKTDYKDYPNCIVIKLKPHIGQLNSDLRILLKKSYRKKCER